MRRPSCLRRRRTDPPRSSGPRSFARRELERARASGPRRPRTAWAAGLLVVTAVMVAGGAAAPAGAAIAVTIARPLDGDILVSPVAIAAAATTDAANARITSWQVYVDGVLVYGTGGSAGSISTSVPMDDGNHELIVRAGDSAGSFDSVSSTVTIGTCSGFTVDLRSPAAGSITSPVGFAAVASSCHRITGFAIYVDGQRVYQQPGSASLEALIDLPAGRHTVAVRATDAARNSASSPSVPIEVEASPPAPPGRPPAKPPGRLPAP